MEKHSTSVSEITQNLLNGFSFEGSNDIKMSLENLRDNVMEHLEKDPIRTVGVAFSLAYAGTKMIRSTDRKEFGKKLLNSAGAALVYGLLNPIIHSKAKENAADEN